MRYFLCADYTRACADEIIINNDTNPTRLNVMYVNPNNEYVMHMVGYSEYHKWLGTMRTRVFCRGPKMFAFTQRIGEGRIFSYISKVSMYLSVFYTTQNSQWNDVKNIKM